MKCAILLVIVASLYLTSAEENEVDSNLRKAMDAINTIVKRGSEESANIEKRERGIHATYGRCSNLGERCHSFQHCCGQFKCRTSNGWYAAFGGTCRAP
ncbi:hypothetical protein SNE40_021708 [Patella caerulea]|uniref:Uncharacterized protein n=1 Tax=Patella caerulea TaxID=87958 RepID=A0AAN8IY29_PATCE